MSPAERDPAEVGAVKHDSSAAAARPTDDQSRDSTTSRADRIPQWMLKLMHDRGSHEYPERSRSRRRHIRPDVSDGTAAPSEVAVTPASQHDSPPAQETACTGEQMLDQRIDSSGDAERGLPLEAPFPTGDGLAEDPPRSACRDSYGDFSSASSTASSSTSFSGFDSRSVSSVTSASSATTFSAAGWNGQAGSPSASSSSFGDRKRSPVGLTSREHSARGAHSVHHVHRDGTAGFGASAGSPTDMLDDATLCLSKLSLPETADLQAPGDSDTTPLASTSLLETPSPPPPPPQSLAAQADESEPTLVSSTPTPAPCDDGTLLAPQNFATVSANLFRSSFPRKENFPFLKNLGLKSVMVLVQEPYPEENADFLREEGIQLFQFGIPGNKEPFVSIPDDKVVAALTTILDKRNHPMLIHCNKGKHRTGCVIGCLRRCQSWSLTSIFDEYRRYSTPKSRAMDLQFIEAFAGLPDVWRLCNRDQLPRWPTLEPPPLPAPADPPSQPP